MNFSKQKNGFNENEVNQYITSLNLEHQKELKEKDIEIAKLKAKLDGISSKENSIAFALTAAVDKAKEIEEQTVNENGEIKTVKKTVNVADPNQYSDYARFFEDGCTGWSKDPEYNLTFLKHQQSQANDILQRRGYLYLNEVYEMLGIPKTKAGHVVGWIYDEKNPIGDNYVDFGIYDLYNERSRAFVNGYERTILLDFNVDGNIWELMS